MFRMLLIFSSTAKKRIRSCEESLRQSWLTLLTINTPRKHEQRGKVFFCACEPSSLYFLSSFVKFSVWIWFSARLFLFSSWLPSFVNICKKLMGLDTHVRHDDCWFQFAQISLLRWEKVKFRNSLNNFPATRAKMRSVRWKSSLMLVWLRNEWNEWILLSSEEWNEFATFNFYFLVWWNISSCMMLPSLRSQIFNFCTFFVSRRDIHILSSLIPVHPLAHRVCDWDFFPSVPLLLLYQL